MLLSPTLRKIATVALLLPAAVMANSSYADCSSESSYKAEIEADHWQAVSDADQAAVHAVADKSGDSGRNMRLSRRAFYGEQPPIAVTDL